MKEAIWEGVTTEKLGFNQVCRFVYAILRNFPEGEYDASRRAAIVGDILPGFFGKDVGRSEGSHKEKGLFMLRWLLIFLQRDAERFQGFVRGFVDGYGEEDLTARIDADPSGQAQREILRLLGRFDPQLPRRIRERLSLKLRKRSELQRHVNWLFSGVIETSKRRQVALTAIDESYLRARIPKSGNPAKVLQQLI